MARRTRGSLPVTMREPPWWYAPSPGLAGRLLGPAGALWGQLVERRFARESAYRATVPVICIGNFTAGGTGKTPLALEVANVVRAMGLKPAFLSRGYGGRLRGPHWVDAAHDLSGDVGDEPLLLAAAHPTLVSRDRASGAREIAEGPTAADVIVMDDGVQNPTIAKDLTLAVVDGARGIGNGRVIPAGPLRASLAFQLTLVDAVVINHGPSGLAGDGPVDHAGGAGPGGDFADRLRRDFEGPVLDACIAPTGATDWLAGAPVVAFAGIGVPDRFFATLRLLGARLAGEIAFPDHHTYTPADAARLLDLARGHGAMLVTTAKDHVRLAGADGPLAELRDAARPLPVCMKLEARDESRLVGLIEGAIGRRTPKVR
jgi:tetraacyldisaccharide 4'-kinase